MDLITIQKIAASAFGRYKAGFGLTDAVDAACCGHNLDSISRTLVESCVVTKMCADDPLVNGRLATLAWRITQRREDPNLNMKKLIARARVGELLTDEAAALSIAAHDDRIWDVIVEIVTVEPLWRIVPERDDGLAERQNRLAKQIASAHLDDRLAAIVTLRDPACEGLGFDAVVAATLSKEIYEALVQVRVSATMTR